MTADDALRIVIEARSEPSDSVRMADVATVRREGQA
jgi:hypothetical protein